MKFLLKGISLLLICICFFSLSACGNDTKTELPSESKSETTVEEPAAIDIDLSVLSGAMVYAEVYRIMTAPSKYLGKTIKIRGMYNASYYTPTQKYYSYVIIADATACCAQGFEFEWIGKSYPQDYPQDGATIEVIGVFGCYDELGITYYSLSVESLKEL